MFSFVRIREYKHIAQITKYRRNYTMLSFTNQDMFLTNRIRCKIGGRQVI